MKDVYLKITLETMAKEIDRLNGEVFVKQMENDRLRGENKALTERLSSPIDPNECDRLREALAKAECVISDLEKINRRLERENSSLVNKIGLLERACGTAVENLKLKEEKIND